MTLKQLKESKYEDFPLLYGYVVCFGTLEFKEIKRNKNGERYPVFSSNTYDTRVYLNKDNAERVRYWLEHWAVAHKEKYEIVDIPVVREIRVSKWHKNVKGEED